MKLTTLILAAGMLLVFGPVHAQIDDDCMTETDTQSAAPSQPIPPLAETKNDYSVAAPAPRREVALCATPRDGQDSTDEGDRVMCVPISTPQ